MDQRIQKVMINHQINLKSKILTKYEFALVLYRRKIILNILNYKSIGKNGR